MRGLFVLIPVWNQLHDILPQVSAPARQKSNRARAYFFLEEAVEDEDEHPLESVEDSEEVSHDDGWLIEEEQAKGPR